MLSKLITNPKPPFVAIMGGAKLSDKLTTIQNLLPKLDKLLIGGGMTYPFLKAKGYEIGKSLCSEQDVTLAKAILHSFENKIIIPVDCALSKNYANDEPIYRPVSAIESDMMGMDIGPETCALYQEILKDARTIV
jgi:phosphoglycerate kinase